MKKRKLFQDLMLLVVGIILAVLLVRTGIAERVVLSLGGLSWLGILIAGMLFTSVFTTGPAIALLGTFASTTPLLTLAILGGLGSMVGDFLIFRFVRDRLAGDLAYLLSFSGKKRLRAIFKTQFFRLFFPLLGALIIASPLPDEIGVAMLGLSRVKSKIFLPLSFILNSAGILAIGWAARALTGL